MSAAAPWPACIIPALSPWPALGVGLTKRSRAPWVLAVSSCTAWSSVVKRMTTGLALAPSARAWPSCSRSVSISASKARAPLADFTPVSSAGPTTSHCLTPRILASTGPPTFTAEGGCSRSPAVCARRAGGRSDGGVGRPWNSS